MAAPALATRAQQPASLEGVVNAMTFRNIGPFRTAAWVTAIDVPEAPLHDHLYTIYAASCSGGLWKTVNAGTTWTNVSDPVGGRGRGGPSVTALTVGEYLVTVNVAGQSLTKTARVRERIPRSY